MLKPQPSLSLITRLSPLPAGDAELEPVVIVTVPPVTSIPLRAVMRPTESMLVKSSMVIVPPILTVPSRFILLSTGPIVSF